MIAVHVLVDEIGAESIRRATLGRRLRVTRLHPATFRRVVDELDARVTNADGYNGAEFLLHTAAGTVRVVRDDSATVEDHLYLEDEQAPRAVHELVQVEQVSTTRMAPVEYVGRAVRAGPSGEIWADGAVQHGDTLLARPSDRPGSHWRPGRVVVGDSRIAIGERNSHYDLRRITAIAEGDYVYRIGKPTTPSLEERVAMLERLVHPDLIIADDAEKSGRPAIAAELRARLPWWRDPGGGR